MNRYNRNPLDGPICPCVLLFYVPCALHKIKKIWVEGGGLESCDLNVLGESVSYTQDESHSGGTTYPTVTLLSTLLLQR